MTKTRLPAAAWSCCLVHCAAIPFHCPPAGLHNLPFPGYAISINRKEVVIVLDTVSLLLVIVGAVNWLLVGVFQFDLVSWLFGGQGAIISRIVYTLVGIAGLWCISLLFRDRKTT